VPAFKPAYLIHGDDHGRIAERRSRLRALAEQESGASGVEVLEGEAATAEAVAASLSAMTFALGRRFVIVEGVERWKEADGQLVAAALEQLDPDTTVAFFAREEGKAKTTPKSLHEAVKRAGGRIDSEQTVKSWDLPKWAVERAREFGIELSPSAGRALVRQVGERQQRLLRELEKLALELGPGARVGVEEVEELAASSAERQVWSLADALVAGDAASATRRYLELREQGERLQGLLLMMVRRVRLALDVAVRLEAGESPAQIQQDLRMPRKAAEALIAAVRRTDSERLRAAIAALADLELTSRGGGDGPAPANEDTAALATIRAIAA
jgi:DNA polymerase-3 subunit delta